MPVTLQIIADQTGLSVTTVSRILNNKSQKYRISDRAKLLVLETARQLNYRPNQVARSLRLKKTQTIGLIVPDISNPFFAHVTRNIQKNVFNNGYSLIVCNTDEDINNEKEQLELLRRKNVDGFIIMAVGIEYEHIIDLQRDNIPFVLLDRCFEEVNTNSVVVDNFDGAFLATEHLIQNGHRRIAIIQGLVNTYTNSVRVEGYRYALKKYNIPIEESLIVGNDFREENGYIETKLLLNMDQPPTAIFTTSDLITLGAYKTIHEENLSIPDDISIIAFDDIDFAKYLQAPLTVIRQPENMMGEAAVKLLFEDINNSSSNHKKRIVLKPELIIRDSVLKLPAGEA